MALPAWDSVGARTSGWRSAACGTGGARSAGSARGWRGRGVSVRRLGRMTRGGSGWVNGEGGALWQRDGLACGLLARVRRSARSRYAGQGAAGGARGRRSRAGGSRLGPPPLRVTRCNATTVRGSCLPSFLPLFLAQGRAASSATDKGRTGRRLLPAPSLPLTPSRPLAPSAPSFPPLPHAIIRHSAVCAKSQPARRLPACPPTPIISPLPSSSRDASSRRLQGLEPTPPD